MGPGSNFCNRCGQPRNPGAVPPMPYPPHPYVQYQSQRLSTVRDAIRAFGSWGSLALVILLAINVAIAIWGIALVYPHMDRHVYLFIITPFLVNFAELGGWAFMAYYVLLVAAIVASFSWMLYKSLRPFTEEIRVKRPEKGHSPLYIIATIFFAILTFNIAYYFIIELFGVSPTTPSFETRELWQIIYGYALASVWEEVVSRILLIGVPLLVIDALVRQWRPQQKMKKLSQYILGGGFDIGRKEAVLLVISSVMFGAAHVFNWDLFKIFPAAVAGLAFGYLFLKLGVYAAIMLHFTFDFLTVPMEVWSDGLAVTGIIGLLILAWLVIGIPYLVLYASRAIGWLLGRRIWPDAPPKPPRPVYASYPPVPPPYGPPAYAPTPYAPPPYSPPVPPPPQASGPGFVCRYCGAREALYADGDLVCTKCGKRY
ncbi:MAG: CPBP family intramembrane metalloprotease [Methanomassiliicoccus sp.]|nr:CPBP family intramembrane metalloprotease [Methanomassiliicoccus sp.]